MTWDEFKDKLVSFINLLEDDLAFIKKAFNFAQKAHEGQKRKSGEPYFNHSLRTALNLAEIKADPIMIVTGILHDVLEDCNVNEKELKKEFGEEVTELIKGVTKIGHYKHNNTEEEQARNLLNLILKISQDLRIAIIKLADRLDNMRTLQYLPPEKIKRIALETRDIFVPLATRLGIYVWASELDELCFKFLEPEKYEWVKDIFSKKIEEGEKYLPEIIEKVEKEIEKNEIKVHFIKSRIKTYSSIYKKLVKKNFDPNLIYDLFGIRIIVDKVEECYRVLGIIHSFYPFLNQEFDDYIAKPKPNGYRSLHTVVLTPYGFYVEFQIRTMEMHEINEYGTAAYFAYSESKKKKTYLKNSTVFASKEDLEILKKIKEIKNFSESYKKTVEEIKQDLLKEKIYVLSPKGKIIELPIGSTPIDFAYQIHTEIGNHAERARVNGKIVPLDYELKNGDVVEILINKKKLPSPDWINFVKTTKAKKKIKKFLLENQIKIKVPLKFSLIIKIKNKQGIVENILDFLKEKKIKIISFSSLSKPGFISLKIKIEKENKKEVENLAFLIKNKFEDILEIEIL